MNTVESEPLWSILDQKGTQTMMRQILGEAGSVTDYDSVRKRLVGSWYTMNFQHGVRFDLTISTGDNFAAATVSSLLNAAVLYRKMSGSDAEKSALSATDISSNSGSTLRALPVVRLGIQQPAQVDAVSEHGSLKRGLKSHGPAFIPQLFPIPQPGHYFIR